MCRHYLVHRIFVLCVLPSFMNMNGVSYISRIDESPQVKKETLYNSSFSFCRDRSIKRAGGAVDSILKVEKRPKKERRKKPSKNSLPFFAVKKPPNLFSFPSHSKSSVKKRETFLVNVVCNNRVCSGFYVLFHFCI